MPIHSLVAILLAVTAILYLLQYYVFYTKGADQKGGSLSSVVFYAMLAYAAHKQFAGIYFLFLLFPALSIVVLVTNWRESDSPRWINILLLLLSVSIFLIGAFLMYNTYY